MTKKSAKPAAPKNPDAIILKDGMDGVRKGMTDSEIYAALASRSYLTTSVLRDYSGFDKATLEITDMVAAAKQVGDEVVSGDLGRIERTLTGQFLALDAIFATLAERSKRQEYLKQMEVYLRLALKAQAQARATAEALALLKNPQPYIRQANISGGHQQINNTYASASAHSGTPTGAETSQLEPSKLLEQSDEQRMDTRAPAAAVRANQAVEAVDSINRPTVA